MTDKFDWFEYLRLIVSGGIPGAAIGDMFGSQWGWVGASLCMVLAAYLLRPRRA